MVRVSHDVAQVDDSEFTLFLDGLVLDGLGEDREVIHRFSSEGDRAAVGSAFRVGHGELHRFGTVPELVRSCNRHDMLGVHRNLQILLAAERPLELRLVVVEVANEVIQFDSLELFLFLDLLARDVLHDRRVVDGLHGEHSVRLGRSAFRVGHDEGNLFGTVPHGARSLDGCNAVLVDFDLQILVAGNGPLQLGKAVVRVRSEFGELDVTELHLFTNHLVRNLLENRHIVHRGHGEHGLGSGLGTFRVGHGERNFVGAIPHLVRDLDLGDMVSINFNSEVATLVLHARSRAHGDSEVEVAQLVIGVLNHFAELDDLELFLFLNGLRSNLLHEFRNVVDGFNRVGNRAFVGSAIRVGDLDDERFGTVPLRARRSHLEHAVRIDRNLEFALAGDGPLEFVLTVVEVFDMLVEFNRLELALFLDRLFGDVLHDRRVIDGFHGELECRGGLAAFRVGSGDGHRFGTVPEFARSLEGDIAGLLVHIDLDILVASHFELQLGEVVVGIVHVFVKNNRREFALFFDGLVRNLLEDRDIVDGLHREGDILLDSSTIRVGAGEGHHGSTIPVGVRNFNRSNAVFVDVHVERAGFRHLALVLHVGIPGEFGMLVVGVLHVFVELDFCKLLLFVDVLVRDSLHEFRLVIHGVHSERSFRFGAGTGRVANLELERLGTIPELARNTDGGSLSVQGNLEIFIARNCPFKLFESVVGIFDQLVQLDRFEVLLFVNRLVGNVLDELRRVVHGLDREVCRRLGGCTGRVVHGEGHRFGTVPEFIGNPDVCGTVLVDIELEVLVAADRPFELGDVVINIANEIGQGDRFEFVFLFDRLARNLLQYGRVVNRLDREGRRLGIACVFAIGRGKLDFCRTIPVRVGNHNRRNALRVDFNIEVAVGLILAHRLDVEFPQDLVLRVVRVCDKVVEIDLAELLAFVDSLVGNRRNYRRIVNGLHREVHRFGTHRTFGVGRRKSDIFGAVPIFVRCFNRHYAVFDGNFEFLVSGYGPLDLFRFVHIVRYIAIQLDRSKLSALLNGFTRNAVHGRSIIFNCSSATFSILSDYKRCQDASGGKQRGHRLHSIHLRSPIKTHNFKQSIVSHYRPDRKTLTNRLTGYVITITKYNVFKSQIVKYVSFLAKKRHLL